MADERARRRIAFASAAVFALTVSVFRVCARPGASGDPIPARHIPISLLTEGDLDLDEFSSIVDVPAPYYLTRRGGHVYSIFPPAGGVLATPFFAAARALGADVVHDDRARLGVAAWTASILSALAVTLVFATYAGRRGFSGGLFVAAALAFGSGVWPLASQDLWQHTFGLPLLAAVLAILETRGDRERLGWMAFAGALAGLAVAVRPTNSILAGILALHVLGRAGWRAFAAFGFAAACSVVPQLLYNLIQFGHPAGAYTREVTYLEPRRMWWSGLPGLFVSPARGLFVLSPVMLLGWLAFRRRAGAERLGLRVAMVAAIVAQASFFGSYRLWWGGWCFGPRHLLEVMPFAASLAGYGLESLRGSRVGRVLAGLALAVSIAINGLGARLGSQQWDAHPPIDHAPARLWDVRDNPVVSDFLGLDPANRYARFWAPGAYRVVPGEPPSDELRSGSWLQRGWTERWGEPRPIGTGREVELRFRFDAGDLPARIVLGLRASPRVEGPVSARFALDGAPVASLELDSGHVREVVIPVTARGPFERAYRVTAELGRWRSVDWRDTFRALADPSALDLTRDAVVLEFARIDGPSGTTALLAAHETAPKGGP